MKYNLWVKQTLHYLITNLTGSYLVMNMHKFHDYDHDRPRILALNALCFIGNDVLSSYGCKIVSSSNDQFLLNA